MVSPRYDVVVVGAGPAGSATAAALAGRGFSVVLLDRAAFPRRKPCGECLNPAAVAALDRLGVLEWVRSAGGAPLRGWRIAAAGGGAFDGAFPPGQAGWAIARERLDAVLLALAAERGAEVRTGIRVSDLLRTEDGAPGGVRVRAASGKEEVRARLVVGADGLRSIVSRRLDLLRRRPRLHKLALVGRVLGVGSLTDRGELHAFQGGCLGLAEIGDGVCNATVVLSGEMRRAAAGDAPGCFDRVLARHGPRGAQRVGSVLATGPFDWPVRAVVADGALLVGDAAGYYDPFTGQGICRALADAEQASAVAATALAAGSVRARDLLPYQRGRRPLRASLRLQRIIEHFVARPRLLSAAAERLARRPLLADALVAVTGDLLPVRSLLRPDLLLGWS
ncbi:MAG: NAD(P)/FAD-dependent oxidoreductase [Longimicrobiaceae bacterium]